jgi:hypothetical protein
MKRTHLLFGMLGCAAFAMAGFGVGALLGTSKVTTATNTDSLSSGVYLTGSFSSWKDTTKMYFKTGSTYSYYIGQTMAASDTFKVHDSEHSLWVNSLSSSVTSGGIFSQDSTSDKNIVCSTAGRYKVTYTYTAPATSGASGTGEITSIEAIDSTSYAISEYRVVDGTVGASVYKTEYSYADQDFTPTDEIYHGYVFGGWFTDSACTTQYVATGLSAATNLYAKYTSFSTDSSNIGSLYFRAPTGWTACYVYTFGANEGEGAWPGKAISASDGLNYQGSGIWKANYYKDSADTTVIFNDGKVSGGIVGTNQTSNLTIADGYYYTLTDSSTGDLDKGSGAAVVYDINAARRAVAASGSIVVGSICGVDKATATTLVAEYDKLNTTAKGYVDAATDYTYNGTDTTTSADIPMTSIVAQLRKISTSNSGGAVTLFNGNQNHDSTVVIVMITAATAIFTAGSLLLLKKKKRA